MKKKLLIAGAFAAVGLQAGIAQAADEAAAKAACAAGEDARKAAAEAKFEWTTTQPLIAKGMEAIAAGDFAQAIVLCDEAKKQGDAAVAQAKQQGEAWKAAVPK